MVAWMPFFPHRARSRLLRCQMYRYEIFVSLIHSLFLNHSHTLTPSDGFLFLLSFSSSSSLLLCLVFRILFWFCFVFILFFRFFFATSIPQFIWKEYRSRWHSRRFCALNLNETHSLCFTLPVWNRAERTHMAIAHKKLCECLLGCLVVALGMSRGSTLNAFVYSMLCAVCYVLPMKHTIHLLKCLQSGRKIVNVFVSLFFIPQFSSIHPSQSDLDSLP